MNEWALTCLTVMAVALLVMAIGQLVMAVTTKRMARQATDALDELRRDLRPVIHHIQRLADDAAKTTGILLTQAERIDEMVAGAARRLDDTLATVQDAIITPVKHGAAIVAGVRAAIDAFRAPSERRHRRREDEDALFIG